jgi:nucleotide-binding universal stress UspA family protein
MAARAARQTETAMTGSTGSGSTAHELGAEGTAGTAAARFGGWRQVLVPVRGGRDAMLRLELALQIAQGTGAAVTALYVVDDRLLADPDAGLVREALEAQLREEGETLLAEMAQLALAAGAPLATRLERGPVVETILKVADELGADVIVVGAHKQTWLGRLLGGSLAETILRSTQCAVLAVPPAVAG